MQWTVFCRVVDNFGDVGVAWRLASDLAGRGERVRLVIDDASALAWMAPQRSSAANAVEVVPWGDVDVEIDDSDVWVETFGCGWPRGFAACIAVMSRPPICIDLEHLSAEAFVSESHGLPLPRFDAAGDALPSWMFYPGFLPGTGGLLREPGLLERRNAVGDGRGWLGAHGIARRSGERCVSLFCYADSPVDALIASIRDQPTLLLVTPGPATMQVDAWLDAGNVPASLRIVRLPALTQSDFDAVLWSADLNVVRGEDSFVRAMWAGVPFVWQAYRQDDGAHVAKVDAFLGLFLVDAPEPFAADVRAWFARWNRPSTALGTDRPLDVPEPGLWARQCIRWRDRLLAQPDLTTALLGFVASKR